MNPFDSICSELTKLINKAEQEEQERGQNISFSQNAYRSISNIVLANIIEFIKMKTRIQINIEKVAYLEKVYKD